MELGELIATLQELKADLVHNGSMSEGQAERVDVRLAFQPRWPFEYRIDKVELVDGNQDCNIECGGLCSECPEAEDCEAKADFDTENDDNDVEPVIYIAEGGQIGYLPGSAQNALGWTER